MHRLASLLLFAVLATTSLAVNFFNIDRAILLEKRQSVNTSGITGVTSVIPQTSISISSTRSTSGASVVETSSTVIVTGSSSVIISVASVTSTITPTNSAGSTTGSPIVVTTASSASYEILTSTFVTSVSSQVLTVYTTTSNGQVVTATSTTNTVVPVTTSARVTGALISASASSSGSSGLSDENKKIIGGVVGGVGGALLLGALGFTAWRIWGRKRNLHDDDLYDPNSQPEKYGSTSENATATTQDTPFRTTLDQYHQNRPVNTASNF